MKKLFSFFTLLVFTIIAFFSNSMMSFAMQNMSDMKMEINMHDNMKKDFCSGKGKSTNNNCSHECCYEANTESNVSVLNSTRENNKKLKIEIKSCIDIFAFSLNSFEDKNLTKITSPPDKQRKLKNYSYKDLTKIIKSNT